MFDIADQARDTLAIKIAQVEATAFFEMCSRLFPLSLDCFRYFFVVFFRSHYLLAGAGLFYSRWALVIFLITTFFDL